jgi:hypothetical protein
MPDGDVESFPVGCSVFLVLDEKFAKPKTRGCCSPFLIRRARTWLGCRGASGPRCPIWIYCNAALGCIDIYEWAATGAIFSQVEERGATHTGCLLATSDEEMRKNGPVPPGCGANRAILHSRPRQWTHHSLRARLRLARFSLATLPARICRYTLIHRRSANRL